MTKNQKRMKQVWKIICVVALISLVLSGIAGYRFYKRIYDINLSTQREESVFLHIPTNSTFDDVCVLLEDVGLLDVKSFRWLAERMNYSSRVRAGRYRLTDGMNNIELVRLLRSGQQVPVKVIFNNIRFNTQLAGAVTSNIEADSASIIALLTDSDYLAERFNLTPQTILSICIPNTYEFFWSTSAKGFLDRMEIEYERFWNESRREKASEANLTPLQVIILASIIEEETQQNSEKPTMAGVFINRLNRGIPLQADATLKFAADDFTIRRVLTIHTQIISPYNTYLNTGLPPGPICIPSIASIDAVLNYVKHDYLFFCAREDFSGYHNFASTLQQHSRNAQAYQRALNNLRIFR